jgi:hypothetical protein
MLTIKVLAALLCGYFDLQRGKDLDSFPRFMFKLMYSLTAALVCLSFSSSVVVWVAFAALFFVGMSPGWGTPLGSMLYGHAMHKDGLEWWQRGKLFETNAVAACSLRGFIWGAPCALLAFWDIAALSALVMTVTFPLSIYLTVQLERVMRLDNSWQTRELIGGLLFGVSALCLSLALQA